MGKTALLVGTGSLGSVVAKYLGNTGIGRIILVDFEELESINVVRHEGTIYDIGKPKVEICKRVIESHNPFTVVETHSFDVTQDLNRIEELAKQSDLIIGSSGSPKINRLLNRISVENNIPAIYCGIYERASGGYVLAVYPGRTACFNCLFSITSQADRLEREEASRYGIPDEELHAQQGLWTDISIPALFMAKTALAMLQDQTPEFNLLLYDSHPKPQGNQFIPVRAMRMKRREDCSVCNFENWVKKQTAEKQTQEVAPKQPSFFSRLKHLLGRVRGHGRER